MVRPRRASHDLVAGLSPAVVEMIYRITGDTRDHLLDLEKQRTLCGRGDITARRIAFKPLCKACRAHMEANPSCLEDNRRVGVRTSAASVF